MSKTRIQRAMVRFHLEKELGLSNPDSRDSQELKPLVKLPGLQWRQLQAAEWKD